jgi:hypothetical protein
MNEFPENTRKNWNNKSGRANKELRRGSEMITVLLNQEPFLDLINDLKSPGIIV